MHYISSPSKDSYRAVRQSRHLPKDTKEIKIETLEGIIHDKIGMIQDLEN
jgi:hypothetical protein